MITLFVLASAIGLVLAMPVRQPRKPRIPCHTSTCGSVNGWIQFHGPNHNMLGAEMRRKFE